MPYYNTQWHKITYINTKYLTKKEAFFQGFQALFLIFNCQTPGKPVSPEKEGLVHFAGLVVFMILMVFVMYNDIMKIIR